ncbi:MAG: DUF1640 domain-containing protein [Magnetococcales bacterium]|nr:DUF1640 domain-containing protein [Magnetococcales bacterium]
MTAITFDTLKYANRLKAAGVPDRQAEAMAETHAEVYEKNLEELATKRDLKDLEVRMDAKFDKELAPLRTDMAVVKWMLTLLVAGVMALVLRSFFPS